MQYLGSKKTLLPFIQKNIIQTVKTNLKDKVFCDLFAGTGIVSSSFEPFVKKIIANDIEYYCYVLNSSVLSNYDPNLANPYIEILNNLKGIEGFVFNEYSCGGSSGRMYFSSENGKRIDAIRQKIQEWRTKKILTDDAYHHLLASLLESVDKVANTTSVYCSYLKELKPSAKKRLFLNIQAELILWKKKKTAHQVFKEDANVLIKQVSGDILYLDPPYNNRQYGANYHLLNTIASFQSFTPKGKTGQRKYYKSKYCKNGEVLIAFKELIKNAQFKYIFLSYNNEGLMSVTDIGNIMSEFGKYKVVSKPYKRFKSSKTNFCSYTMEFLHILEKA